MNDQEYLLRPIVNIKRPGAEGSKRNFCCIFDCGRVCVSRKTGLCLAHARRLAKGQDLLKPVKPYKEELFCSIHGCNNKFHAKHLCLRHYYFMKKNGDPLINKLPRGRRCSIEGCFNEHYGKSYCTKHYRRFKKHGDPLFCKYTERYSLCSISGCNTMHKGKGFCSYHYHLNITKIK